MTSMDIVTLSPDRKDILPPQNYSHKIPDESPCKFIYCETPQTLMSTLPRERFRKQEMLSGKEMMGIPLPLQYRRIYFYVFLQQLGSSEV